MDSSVLIWEISIISSGVKFRCAHWIIEQFALWTVGLEIDIQKLSATYVSHAKLDFSPRFMAIWKMCNKIVINSIPFICCRCCHVPHFCFEDERIEIIFISSSKRNLTFCSWLRWNFNFRIKIFFQSKIRFGFLFIANCRVRIADSVSVHRQQQLDRQSKVYPTRRWKM